MRDDSGRDAIALIGDLHSCWDDHDVEYFNRAAYELLLFTGDLGGSASKDGLRIARSMSRLVRPALVMPGNNDVEHYPRFAAELAHQRGRLELMMGPGAQLSASNVRTCGYSLHPLRLAGLEVTIVAARPFAMGNDELSFTDALVQSFGVETLDQSLQRLRALVDAVTTEHVVFLAHNGPRGLGEARDAPWGSDFAAGGDWGDRDLELAIAHARQRGLRVLAVIAGHMHWFLQGGGMRRWQLERDGTLYVNPARVPRHFAAAGGTRYHHVALWLSAESARAAEVLAAID